MSPPGKNSGFTTKESVVMARRWPFTFTIAWSSRRASTGFRSAGRKTSRINSALSLPPLPCPNRIVSLAGSGSGQLSSTIVFVDTHSPNSRPYGADSDSKPRMPLPWKPWALPMDFPAYSACQKRDNPSASSIPAKPGR